MPKPHTVGQRQQGRASKLRRCMLADLQEELPAEQVEVLADRRLQEILDGRLAHDLCSGL
jgi:hypothetical protein